MRGTASLLDTLNSFGNFAALNIHTVCMRTELPGAPPEPEGHLSNFILTLIAATTTHCVVALRDDRCISHVLPNSFIPRQLLACLPNRPHSRPGKRGWSLRESLLAH